MVEINSRNLKSKQSRMKVQVHSWTRFSMDFGWIWEGKLETKYIEVQSQNYKKNWAGNGGAARLALAGLDPHTHTHPNRTLGNRNFLKRSPFLELKLEAKTRSFQATAVREVAKSWQRAAICLDFEEGCVYKSIFRKAPKLWQRPGAFHWPLW